MVTVEQLIQMLAQSPKDLPVILSSDAEGNWYSPLYDVGEVMYVSEGEIYLTNEQVDLGPIYTDEDRPPANAVKVVALWPA